MFASGRRKSSLSTKQHEDEEECRQLTTCLMNNNQPAHQAAAAATATTTSSPLKNQQINNKPAKNNYNNNNKKAKLARIESICDEENEHRKPASCARMALNLLKRKLIFIPLIILICIAAIYCVPYIEIHTRIPKALPHIPFNFQDGPLRASTVSQFKIEHLFRNQVSGPESIAIDSMGNMYMAIEGGFILYAHLNKSSPFKSYYYDPNNTNSYRYTLAPGALGPYSIQAAASGAQVPLANERPNLIKIAELNGVKQTPYSSSPASQEARRARLADFHNAEPGFSRRQSRAPSMWKRECQLDEKIYGPKLYSSGDNLAAQQQELPAESANEIDTNQNARQAEKLTGFTTNVHISRCSKPLGIRLSPDESFLYVVDTLSGLYRVSLRVAERPFANQRLVQRLIDFRHNRHQLLPVVQLDIESNQAEAAAAASQVRQQAPAQAAMEQMNGRQMPASRNRAHLNVSLLAVDDLVVDYGAGLRGGDIIYMSLASQNWQATSFIYDILEGRPSSLVLRYDTGSNQLSVLNPAQVSLVRTSSNLEPTVQLNASRNPLNLEPVLLGLGAPHLDENDVFDDRPLYFTNGLELTDDKQALLIVDTSNKRIIKHYIRGDRRGTSDHWAWTPNFPDNIRRGSAKHDETYWVVGCGQAVDGKKDFLELLHDWPMLRKYILKNFYLFGWLIEQFGARLLDSTSVRDFGYSIKVGHTFCEKACSGLMILQYNQYGDIIRTIHSKEFPHDTIYYSQVNEVVDAINQEHVLYLSSPSYNYVTKLTLPTDSLGAPTPVP